MNKSYTNSILPDRVDGLLTSYFQREMPNPWPEAKAPRAGDIPLNKHSLLRSHGRLALVASVAFILLSYLTLAAMFPAEPEPGLILNRHQTIGSKPGIRVPTSRGGEAFLWEETIPGERPTIIINVQEIKGPQKR